jgi:hypothetical protein
VLFFPVLVVLALLATENSAARIQAFEVVSRLVPDAEDPVGTNRPLHAAALRMPFVYAIDRAGDLYVFKAPQEVTIKDVLPVRVIRNAGDGIALKLVRDCLLCSRSGSLEVYSLTSPESPRYVGRFGPAMGPTSSMTIVAAERNAFLIGEDGILAYDLANLSSPRYLGITRVEGSWTACLSGKYLYVGEERLNKKRRGIAIYDIASPAALREIGFIPTERMPYDLFAVNGGLLLASTDGRLLSFGDGVNGNAELFSLAIPDRPKLIGRYGNAGGRAATVVTSSKGQYFAYAGGVCAIHKDGLRQFVSLPTGGSLLDSIPYHGDADGGYAALALGQNVTLIRRKASGDNAQ